MTGTTHGKAVEVRVNDVAAPDSADTRPLEARYAEVVDRVSAAARRSGRKPGDVLLVAVTKNASPEQIRALLDLGHRDFGENRVPQLVQRAAMLEEALARLRMHPSLKKSAGMEAAPLFAGTRVELRPVTRPGESVAPADVIRWHMIGHLQRNKAKKVIDVVRLVHSVDSLRLAEELQAIALKRDRVVEVLLQVNCSGEATKFGCPMPAAMALAEQIETMANVRLRGLMTMAAVDAPGELARPAFARCRELFEEMRKAGVCDASRFNLLSMGMTSDYEAGILEGANIVRVGSAIFGPPQPEMPEHEGHPEEPSGEDGDGQG